MKVITLMYKVPIVTKLPFKEHDGRSGGGGGVDTKMSSY